MRYVERCLNAVRWTVPQCGYKIPEYQRHNIKYLDIKYRSIKGMNIQGKSQSNKIRISKTLELNIWVENLYIKSWVFKSRWLMTWVSRKWVLKSMVKDKNIKDQSIKEYQSKTRNHNFRGIKNVLAHRASYPHVSPPSPPRDLDKHLNVHQEHRETPHLFSRHFLPPAGHPLEATMGGGPPIEPNGYVILLPSKCSQ